MKNLFIAILAAGMVFTSCTGKTKNNPSVQTVKKEKTTGTIRLNKADFLAKVFNYEKNPKEWNYLGDKPAIVDFYADWCGPCKALAPTMEDLAAEYKGKIHIYEINVDEEQELAGFFGIQSIPSLLFIPMKGKPKMELGLAPKKDLQDRIDNFLLK